MPVLQRCRMCMGMDRTRVNRAFALAKTDVSQKMWKRLCFVSWQLQNRVRFDVFFEHTLYENISREKKCSLWEVYKYSVIQGFGGERRL
jgi:hypothetical protein